MKILFESIVTALMTMLKTLIFIVGVMIVITTLELIVCTLFYAIWG